MSSNSNEDSNINSNINVVPETNINLIPETNTNINVIPETKSVTITCPVEVVNNPSFFPPAPEMESGKKIYESMFPTCYYGCKLDSLTQKWDCKRSIDFKTADSYALSSNKNDGRNYPTKIIPVSCYDFKYPELLQKAFLYHKLNFDVGQIKEDDYVRQK